MARQARGQEEAFGNDSFLDVVANIVGILIILVVVASTRIKNMPSLLSPELRSKDQATAAFKDAEASMTAPGAGRHGPEQRNSKSVDLHGQPLSGTRGAGANPAQKQRELDEQRNSLDGQSREQFDLEHAVATAEAKLTQATRLKREVDLSPPPTIEIKTYPTPISQVVYGKELHFQLKRGLVAHIPLEALLEKFKRRAHEQVDRLQNEREFSDIVGPVDGFRLKYIVERVDMQPESGRSGSYVQLRQFILLPMSEDLGETLEDAVARQSRFVTALSGLDPKHTTITLWTYDDSFAIFRELQSSFTN